MDFMQKMEELRINFILKTSYPPNVVIMNRDTHWKLKHEGDLKMGINEEDRWTKIHSCYGMRVFIDDVDEIKVGFVMKENELL